LVGEDIGGQEGFSQDSARGRERHILPVSHRSDTARPKGVAGFRGGRRVRFVEAEIGRTAMRDEIARGFGGFPQIAWRKDEHVGKGAEDGEILGGVVRETDWAVAHATADANDLHVRAVVADVVSDLLQAAQCREVADGIGKNRVALQRKAGSQARHVLLGDADVKKLPGEAGPVPVEDLKAQVASQEEEFRVLWREFGQGVNESVSHEWASSSASAASNSAPRGMR
jgi:hypothetical protein